MKKTRKVRVKNPVVQDMHEYTKPSRINSKKTHPKRKSKFKKRWDDDYREWN